MWEVFIWPSALSAHAEGLHGDTAPTGCFFFVRLALRQAFQASWLPLRRPPAWQVVRCMCCLPFLLAYRVATLVVCVLQSCRRNAAIKCPRCEFGNLVVSCRPWSAGIALQTAQQSLICYIRVLGSVCECSHTALRALANAQPVASSWARAFASTHAFRGFAVCRSSRRCSW